MEALRLDILDTFPEALFDLNAEELNTVLNGPTLIHLRGQNTEPLFVSVLQHGNEHSGWEAIKHLLQKYRETTLPRSLSIFIGNIQAAKNNTRFIPEQGDFNRMWGSHNDAAHPCMQSVIESMRARNIFMSVDIHNNTGLNPYYACINRTDEHFVQLASQFSENIIFFTQPEGVQSLVFSHFCTALTLECGISGDPEGIDKAFAYLDFCLNLKALPQHDSPLQKHTVYQVVGTAKIREDLHFDFAGSSSASAPDFSLNPDLEKTNFSRLKPGFHLGKCGTQASNFPIQVFAENGQDVSDEYLRNEGDWLSLKREVVPAMFTPNIDIIRKDCLCYFMEPYPLASSF